MSETSNHKKSASTDRKRKFKQQYHGQNKRRKLNDDGKKPQKYDIGQLTKSRNILLCSCQKYKEKRCGRDLQRSFSRYIEQYLKENNIENGENDKTKDEKKEDKDNNDKTEEETTKKEMDDEDEDIDLKMTNKDKTKENNAIKDENQTETNGDNKPKDGQDEDEDIDLKMKNNDETEKEDTKERKKEVVKSVNIADEISKELSSFHKNKLCEWYEAPSGLVAIEIFNKKIPASKLLKFIFDKHHPNKPDDLSPFVFKLVPMDLTSYAKIDDMINLGKQMIEREKFGEISKDDSYGINYKNRGNKQLDRNEIIKGIAGFVPEGYKVNLSQPKTVIILQTFSKVAGLSIIKDGVFTKHKEYNMSNFKE
eukprot:CAMPEP_0201594784 /NCGR_PEP_ID=MMETSP0190_2-20130828/191989_1 /ASSEMBLY_ACC=CAM_ASM_000263 /TAXON_ID=37353 /ORGANISM="Rosalina sp." /LENGTH=365 /DNA_ID=CAMNT_0048054519 /DNA_START=34 /DNA_END=1131 /DNA_ORIENTATION=-